MMMNAEKFLYILSPIFFDGLTELVYKIKNINKLNSVKTPSKLRQNLKLMTGNSFFSDFFKKVLTDYKIFNINNIQQCSVKVRQIEKPVLTEF